MNNEKMRHGLSHILASAVLELYPQTKLAIGPAIDDGFYYDFEFTQPIGIEDLPTIEQKMREMMGKKIKFEQEEWDFKKAREFFKDQIYKLELIDELEQEGEENVSVYTTASLTDLCKGPHVKNSSHLGAFKLDRVAGAYWRGSEKNPMLTRIYGLAFKTQAELEHYQKLREEAKKHDHRKVGKELDLYSFHPVAPADIFWHPKGWTVFKELVRYWRDIHEREGYVEVRTPELLSRKIWDQSGHTKFFLDKMYQVTTPEADEWDMAIKPMNCDGGILVYASHPRSYKEFPLRMGELGVVHRFEGSGETHGILRPREFTQDDAHIYCTPDQVKEELKRIMELCFEVYETLGLELNHLELSTRPENSIGSDEIWKQAETIMREVLSEKSVPHQINEGDGAFYGPKFDFHLKDSVGRTWQCSTIQLDFAQPENFDLEYVTEEGIRERPVMIHRVLYGSVERFLGIVIEDCAGAFPVWLAPIQAIIVPITENQANYAEKVARKLQEQVKNPTGNFRVEVDTSSETMQKKIRNAQLLKIPYMLIVGEREEKSDQVAVRLRTEEDLGAVKLEEFIDRVKEKIEGKSLEL